MAYAEICEEISTRLGYSVTIPQVAQDFKIAMKEWSQEHQESTTAIRALIQERLDLMLKTCLEKAQLGSTDHVELVLKIEAQRARLLGLNKEKTGPRDLADRPRLTEGELRDRIAAIQARLSGGQHALPEHVDAEVIDTGSGPEAQAMPALAVQDPASGT